MADKTRCVDVFEACCIAVQKHRLIHRAEKKDKEFHFQNWFAARLGELDYKYDPPARNSYPDFRLVNSLKVMKSKGLHIPVAKHRTIQTARYPLASTMVEPFTTCLVAILQR